MRKNFLSTIVKRVVLLAIVTSIINLALSYAGRMIMPPASGFGPYMPISILSLTIIGVVGAGIVYAIFRRSIHDIAKANRYFITFSVILLVLSFIPDALVPWSPIPDEAGWTTSSIINLMIMHLITGVLTIYTFTRKER